MNDINELLSKTHIKTKKLDDFDLALTHPSYNSESNTKHHDYERLEFMGDRVIGFISADLIFKNRPEMDQGLMSKLQSKIVRSDSLAKYGRQIELYKYIKTGHSITQNQLFNSNKIIEDVFEAFTGAIYLNCGMKVAYEFIESIIMNDVLHTNEDDLIDPKTRLQQEMQSEYRESVKYVVIDEEGPANDKTYYVQVEFNGLVLGKGQGKSKKLAEEDAAADALRKRSV